MRPQGTPRTSVVSVISVLIPNYNRMATLIRAVLSVLRQADGQVEVIVVDDGSEADLSRTYHMLEAAGTRVLRLPARRGGSVARNTAVEAATGDHVSFLDSDDVWLPGHYARLRAVALEFADRARLSGVMVYQWGEVVGFDQPAWPDGMSPVDFVYRDGGRLQTSMLTLPLSVARAHPFREDLRVNQDSDFAMRLHASGVRFHLDPVPGVIKDDSDSDDRLSREKTNVDLSYAWFKAVSGDWSAVARSGYYIRDRAWRLVGAGRRVEALGCVLRGNLPPVAPAISARIAGEAILGHGGYARVRNAFRGLFPKPQAVVGENPALVWLQDLDAEARRLVREPAPAGSVPAGRAGSGAAGSDTA
jgi:glycosyltransferase involved in cell wall biosynthesis